jgi:diguanylate cyclase (GGDEF)-like protein
MDAEKRDQKLLHDITELVNKAEADRKMAASDRANAALDRLAADEERRLSALDSLTGVYVRGVGFMELQREMRRAKRLAHTFVVAFVDVDNLKTVNDLHGHAAGDHLLRRVAGTLGQKLRSYDLVMRYGGDEFVCALSDLPMAAVLQRFEEVREALAPDGAVTVGLAEMLPDDTAEELVVRADADLYRRRAERGQRGRL